MALLLATGVAIAVAGAAMLGSMSIDRSEREWRERVETTAQLERIEEALRQFVTRNGRLPCPSHGTANIEDPAGRQEQRDGLRCDWGTGEADQGVVPWETLGLQPVDVVDRWGMRISYRPFEGDDTGEGSLVQDNGMNFRACALEIGQSPAVNRCVHATPAELQAMVVPLEAWVGGELLEDVVLSQGGGGGGGEVDGLTGTLLDPLLGSPLLGDLFSLDVDSLGVTVAIDPNNGRINIDLPGDLEDLLGEDGGVPLVPVNLDLEPSHPDYMTRGYGWAVDFFRRQILRDLGARVVMRDPDGAGDPVPDMVPTDAGAGAAFLLISHGENGRGAWTPAGTRMLAPESPTEDVNVDDDSDFMNAGFRAIDGANAFDDLVLAVDIVEFASAAELYIPEPYDPAQCARIWPARICALFGGLVGVDGGAIDIIQQDEDLSSFNATGTGNDQITVTAASAVRAQAIAVALADIDAASASLSGNATYDPVVALLATARAALVADPGDLDQAAADLGQALLALSALPSSGAAEEIESARVQTGLANRAASVLNFGNPTGAPAVDAEGNPIILEGDGVSFTTNRSGCVWIDQALQMREEVVRVFWEFRIYGSSVNSADGYVFSFVPGTTVTDAGTSSVTASDGRTATVNNAPCGNSKHRGRFSNSSQYPSFYDLAEPGQTHPLETNGSDLAFIGSRHLWYSQFATFDIPKFGLEFDFWNSEGYNRRNDPANNHIAVVRENSVVHGSAWPCGGTPTSATQTTHNSCTQDWMHREWLRTNPPCVGVTEATADRSRGCIVGTSRNYLEDRAYTTDPTTSAEPYRIRVEAQRGCDASCGACGNLTSGTHILMKAWIDCSADAVDADGNTYNLCSDVTRSYDDVFDSIPDIRTIDQCILDPEQDSGTAGDFDTIKMGFSAGTGGFVSGMQLTRFAAANTNLPPEWTVPDSFGQLLTMPELPADNTPLRFLAASLPDRPQGVGLTDREASGRNGGLGDYNDLTIWVRRRQSITGVDLVAQTVSLLDNGRQVSDVFGIDGTGAGFTVSGGQLLQGGVAFADFTARNGELRISFDSSAGVTVTQALLDQVLERVTYANSNLGSQIGVVLELLANDGRGGTNATTSATVAILAPGAI